MPEQPKTLSPRGLADAIGVSESSIRRWVDDGLIDVTRTAGGHRRITVPAAVRFVRSQNMRVFRPELLGLPELNEVPVEAVEGAVTADLLHTLVTEGETLRARAAIVNAYLGGTSLAELYDGPVSGVLHRLGELWNHEDRGIYLEHVATTVCIEAMSQLRALMQPPADGAAVALGGAPAGDPYILPSLMAATVLADLGYRETNLGPNTPASAVLHAADDHAPDLVWLATTSALDETHVRQLVDELVAPLEARGVEVVVGGHAASGFASWSESVRVLASMSALAAFASGRIDGAMPA